MSKNPLIATDFIAIILIILGSIFIYAGLVNNESWYIMLGVFEVLLSILQFYLNRSNILIS